MNIWQRIVLCPLHSIVIANYHWSVMDHILDDPENVKLLMFSLVISKCFAMPWSLYSKRFWWCNAERWLHLTILGMERVMTGFKETQLFQVEWYHFCKLKYGIVTFLSQVSVIYYNARFKILNKGAAWNYTCCNSKNLSF